MKRLKTIPAGLAMALLAQSPALAMDRANSASSGMLTGLFVGFCALLIMMQLMPTVLLLMGSVNRFFRKNPDDKELKQGI
jgi:hypothetical protein